MKYSSKQKMEEQADKEWLLCFSHLSILFEKRQAYLGCFQKTTWPYSLSYQHFPLYKCKMTPTSSHKVPYHFHTSFHMLHKVYLLGRNFHHLPWNYSEPRHFQHKFDLTYMPHTNGHKQMNKSGHLKLKQYNSILVVYINIFMKVNKK